MMQRRLFYILTEGKVRGPFPEQGVLELAGQGKLPADAQLSEDGRTWHAPEAILPPGSVLAARPNASGTESSVSGSPPPRNRTWTGLSRGMFPRFSGRAAIGIAAAALGGLVLLAAIISAAWQSTRHGYIAWDTEFYPSTTATPLDFGDWRDAGDAWGSPESTPPPQTENHRAESDSGAKGPTGEPPSSNGSPEPDRPPVVPPPPPVGPADWLERVQKATVTILTDNGLGSGFFVDSPSLRCVVVTNSHVVEDVGVVQVRLHDGTLLGVNRGSAYPQYDLAFLAVDGLHQPPAILSLRESLPKLTEKVFAYGAPLGFSGTVTEGIVSAVRTTEELDRNLQDLVGAMTPYDNIRWIQTTAAISPGNSGGPLVDAQGRVVGVNTLALSADIRAQNLNFAVSADQVISLLPSVQLSRFPPPQSSQRAANGGGDDLAGLSETGEATLRYWLTMKAALQIWKQLNSTLPQIERFPVGEQIEILLDFAGSCLALIDFLNELDESNVDREAIQCKSAICDLMNVFVKSLQVLVQNPGNPRLQAQVAANLQRTVSALNRAEQNARTTLSQRYGVAFPSLLE
ncbi:S1C family serine protease [Thermopirellula anaerolimosa]